MGVVRPHAERCHQPRFQPHVDLRARTLQGYAITPQEGHPVNTGAIDGFSGNCAGSPLGKSPVLHCLPDGALTRGIVYFDGHGRTARRGSWSDNHSGMFHSFGLRIDPLNHEILRSPVIA